MEKGQSSQVGLMLNFRGTEPLHGRLDFFVRELSAQNPFQFQTLSTSHSHRIKGAIGGVCLSPQTLTPASRHVVLEAFPNSPDSGMESVACHTNTDN